MRTTLVSAILLTLSAVDAKKHRLCCCSGIDDNAPGLWSEKSITCLQKPSEEVVAEAPRYKFIKSNQIWSYNLDKNAPFGDANSTHWWYANTLPYDDGWVGGNEAHALCDAKGFGSTCFTPRTAEYRNAGTFKRSTNIDQEGEPVVVERSTNINQEGEPVVVERSTNINQEGEPVVVERDVFDIMERDVLERGEAATKPKPAKPTKHHGAGYHKHKNSTSTHHGKENSTSTQHPKAPKTTAKPMKVADLLERDILERKENSTKPAKHHGTKHHHKNSTSTHHGKKNGTSTTKHSTTKHPKAPKTTAKPTKVADLLERDVITERGVNATTTKKHHPKTHASGKPKTTFHQITKSGAHHFGNGTHHAKPTAIPKGVVYCNQYWKAPGCVPRPATTGA